MMLKKEFLDKVAENAGLYKYQAYMFWKAFEEVLIEELRQGEKIKIDWLWNILHIRIQRVQNY